MPTLDGSTAEERLTARWRACYEREHAAHMKCKATLDLLILKGNARKPSHKRGRR
jgi:hypothetical protein